MSASLVLIGLLIAAVFIAAGAMVMTLINLGYYCNARPARERKGQRDIKPADGAPTPLISVCVPARNEEANIEACVRAVLASDWPSLEVLVYDDQSTDGTSAILARLMQEDARVRRVDTAPLPAGWVGKQWACEQLGKAARGAWLLFIDADVRIEPGALRATHDTAASLRTEMVSTFPRQITGTLGEQLTVPMIHFILFSYLPMGQMRGSTAPSASAACGQYLFVRREAYREAGGHAAWKASMHDGIRMARAVRRAGFHSDLFDAGAMVRCRMYDGFGSSWRGFAKNAYEGLGSLGLLLFLTVIHAIGHVLPWVIIVGAAFEPEWRGPELVLASAAALIALAQRAVLARRFAQPAVGVVLHPVCVVLMTLIQWHSFVLAKTGRRTWRGRGSARAVTG